MAMHEEPNVEELAGEARQREQRGEFAEALDFYEEIDRRGAINVEHLMAMGNCYLQTRQRQDARKTWLRAFALAPDHQPVIDLRNRHFKGWEKALAPKGASSAEFAPPPPPPVPPGGGSSTITLTVETSSSGLGRQAKPAPLHEEEPASNQTAARGPVQRPVPRADEDEEDSILERTGSLRPAARPMPQQAAPAARPVPPTANRPFAGSHLPPVNWDYVMADAMVESDKKH